MLIKAISRSILSYSFADIESISQRSYSDTEKIPLERLRSSTPICIIDDVEVPAADNLRTYGYNVTVLKDIDNIKAIQAYQVILVDIIGVGSKFDRNAEGAAIILEIKKNFPEKFVFAYTGNARDGGSRRALAKADGVIQKDIETEELVDLVDGYARLSHNPVEVWEKIRSHMVSRRVSTKDLLLTEDAFVKSVRARDRNYNGLKDLVESDVISSVTKSVIQQVIAGIALSIILA